MFDWLREDWPGVLYVVAAMPVAYIAAKGPAPWWWIATLLLVIPWLHVVVRWWRTNWWDRP